MHSHSGIQPFYCAQANFCLCLTMHVSLWAHLMHACMLQENPEGHVRSQDVETGPDADTPRPCGLALLLCMRDRGPESTDAALIGYASRLQVGLSLWLS